MLCQRVFSRISACVPDKTRRLTNPIVNGRTPIDGFHQSPADRSACSDAPDLVALGWLGHGALGGFHAVPEFLDFVPALGLVALFPLDAVLDVAAEGSALGMGKHPGSVEGKALVCVATAVVVFCVAFGTGL